MLAVSAVPIAVGMSGVPGVPEVLTAISFIPYWLKSLGTTIDLSLDNTLLRPPSYLLRHGGRCSPDESAAAIAVESVQCRCRNGGHEGDEKDKGCT